MEKIGALSPPAPGQDPDQDKDAFIKSLISENESLLRSNKSLLAEKEAQLRLLRQTGAVGGEGYPTTSNPKQHELHGLELELAGTSSTEESVATYADYLEAQQKLKVRNGRNSVFSTMTHWTNATNATVRSAKELEIIRNIASRRGGAEWDQYYEDDLLGEDGKSVGDEHQQSKKNMAWYFPPVQRQRWGEEQSLPHVNWGDLFFDLFYVGAAYNL